MGQFADLTFDVSIADIFMAWTRGGTLCCPSQRTLLNPSAFLRQQRISIFQGVPSHAALMARLGALKPGSFPDIRVSVSAGEPLPCSLARAWSLAAPRSVLDNLYGPAECTVHATAYRWDAARSDEEAKNGTVPIGQPLSGFGTAVVDEHDAPVNPGEAGELCLSGPQVSPGYLNDGERTRAAFGPLSGLRGRWYRTGDRVRLPPADGPLRFLGRRDQQIKVGGIRIELGEVEAALRAASGQAEVACLGWPVTQTGAGGIVAFVCSPGGEGKRIREELRRRLPPQLVPREVRVVEELPRTRSGKVDRQALAALLEREGR